MSKGTELQPLPAWKIDTSKTVYAGNFQQQACLLQQGEVQWSQPLSQLKGYPEKFEPQL